MAFLVSCASSGSVGLYGPNVPTGEVSGSWAQAKRVFVVNYDTEDSKAAAERAFNLEGLDFDVRRNNMMSGKGAWFGGGLDGCECGYAVYFQ